MNQIVNKFLLAGDKLCLKCILNNLDLLIVLVDYLLDITKEFKNLCKNEIQIIFAKMYWIKLVINMILLMANTNT